MNVDTSFSINLRVYYEDTDAAGIVYHTNYLKYMERARTEMLRTLGVLHEDQNELGRVFVVARADLRFRQPACLDEELTVTADIVEVKRASVLFEQQVLRGDELICSGDILIANVDRTTMKPVGLAKGLFSQ